LLVALYVFKCQSCSLRAETTDRLAVITCELGDGDHGQMVRDYRAEGVGVAVQQLKNEREAGGTKAHDALFLPTNKDFAGPGDPDGTKGMRQWRDTHQPKAGNSKPRWPGEVDKKVW
jgi:hypothetical protein